MKHYGRRTRGCGNRPVCVALWSAAPLVLAALWSTAEAGLSLPIEGAPGKNFQTPWDQIRPNELLILVNASDPQSVAVADDYMARYAIPSGNRLELNFTAEATIRDNDFNPLYDTINNYLQNHAQLQATAVTWTEPWKVSPQDRSVGMSITSAITFGFAPEYYNSGGGMCTGTARSPLFGQALTQPYTDFGLRPAMMLAGTSAANVSAMLDRSTAAKSTFPLPTGYLVRTTDSLRSVRYPQMQDAASYWTYPFGLSLDYIDNAGGNPADDSISGATDVLYYFTGLAQVAHLETLQFVRGAVADHLTSTAGALTETSQMSILRWLEAGASGSFGTVEEPCNLTQKFTVVDQFLLRYFSGAPLIDAYWQAVEEPGEGLFVGDPLAQPYAPAARVNGAGQVELTATAYTPSHLYKVVGVDAGGNNTKLLEGVHVDTPQLRVLSVPPGYAGYKLVDTANLQDNHGAPQLTAASISRLDLGNGTVRFDIHADDREGDQVYYSFQRADGRPFVQSHALYARLVLEGDVNGDGFVNFLDLGLQRAAMWSQVGDVTYNAEADIDNDGQVNLNDVSKLKANFLGTHAYLRVYTTQHSTTDLTFFAFDRWGSESRMTGRIGNGSFVVLPQ